MYDVDWQERNIDSLEIGDKIMGPHGPTQVIAFIHRDPDHVPDFVTLTTTAGKVTLTHQHMLTVNGELTAADAVKAGDVLTNADGKTTSVERMEHTKGRGAYHLFVDTPSYYAHNNGRGAPTSHAFEVSNLMLWKDWGLSKFVGLYESAQACYAKGKPYNFKPEVWMQEKSSAFVC